MVMDYRTLLVVAILCMLMVEDVVFSEENHLHKTIYPERLDSHRYKRDLSTATKGGHEDTASFMLMSFDSKNIQIDVKRNKKLISPSFTMRYFNSDGSEVISKDAGEHCHYQGSIRGQPDSTVVLNTCSGLRGIIDTQDDTYHIEPHQDYQNTGAHKIYPATDSFDINDCGHSHDAKHDEGSSQHLHDDDKLKAKYSRVKRALLSYNIDEFYRPFLTTDETRYTELLMVADNGMYKRYNSDIKTVQDKVITLVNAVDAIYQRINIRIMLSVLEIWSSGDRMKRNTTGTVELEDFRTYRDQVLKPKYPHDNAQFLSHYYWTDAAGWGYMGGLCGYNSVGVNAWSFSSIIGPYVTVAHEMGHNFNFKHDADGHYCKCLTPRGCIMGGHKTRVPGFSNCSMIFLKDVDDSCLYNVPTQAVNQQCGNGIREGNEECDCGTPEMCAAKDPCCEPHGCKLKVSSQCSDLHHTCCQSCVFKKHGTLCRDSSNECDLPEYCTGTSGDCPGNSYLHDGSSCDQTGKIVHGNSNFYGVVTNKLSPYITARYVRINPHYWNHWPCMRTELFGCSTGQVSATAPTPLKAYNDFCLVPSSDSCSPADGSKPVFKSGYECKQNYMEFSLDANGILRHHCSGKKICPQNGGTATGTTLVMSSSCSDANSKFVRTSGKSLKHLASGKCVHPNGGWPGNNVELVIWGGCDVQRLEFWFMKQDCVIPLGMRSQSITDNQITASSHKTNNDPKYGRLQNSKSWCAKEKKQTEYLQIDLGQVQKVSSISTQGANGANEWVNGYYVYYSLDGKQWNGYTGGISTQDNSYCHKGKCQETHDKQCKNLWGATGEQAAQGCYDKLNTEAQGYGTCSPSTNSSCAAADVLCGQVQCQSSLAKPAEVDYGWSYTKISLTSGHQCSAATLKKDDSLGEGMVKDGTKCGNQKMCQGNKCQSIGVSCPMVNDQMCAGRGVCKSNGVCHCNNGYDSSTACNTVLQAVDGGFSVWSTWSKCSVGCNGGTQTRHRFCNNPTPLNGGQDCQGERTQSRDCNTDFCPIARSCRDLQSIGQADNKSYPDGIYQLYPDLTSDVSVKTYCDMSRDGGGWTLLVASHTNSWTADNVKLRNPNSPSLYNDYSILKYADVIKNDIEVEGLTFEYRLEAQNFGRWGGIWKTDRTYSFTATNDKQTNVELIKKFDNWQTGDRSIEQRMPWLNGEQLTTSKKGSSNWGTITDNEVNYHPAPWIYGDLMEQQPAYIWYWMREGPANIPSSCAELQLRGYTTNPLKDGVYKIKPPGKGIVDTYCDFTTDGGGWTLLATSKTHTGWTSTNVKERNTIIPSLDSDYSILGWADAIKNKDTSQEYFQYRIEADGASQYGGIFDAPRSHSFVATSNTQTNIKLVKNYNNIDPNSNLAKRMPRMGLSSDIFLSCGSSSSDTSGSIIYNGAGPQYLPGIKPTPGVVRYWMREGTRRSCNDIKLHGVRAGRSYQDGYYMVRFINHYQYLPVFCDMTSQHGAFTLIVTSRHNSWTRAQVLERNIMTPSLNNDYSILKYADMIKNLSNGATFEYKLDAHQRGHWGGIWKAPHDYSFMADNNKQTAVTEVKKFDDWTYSWWNSLNLRMPWYNVKEASTKALLTTSVDVDYYPSGSIIWGHADRHPADWISKDGMGDPGLIWYWLNEDDCDANRQPVNGGLSDWSQWSTCNKLCATGQQMRHKTCTNPKPRCGGTTCNGVASETKSCYVCPESPIKSYNGLCVQPNTASCNQAEGSHLIFKTGDSTCSQSYQNFLFDSNGVIHHKCSGLVVCPEGNDPTWSRKLLLQKTCDQSISRHQRLSSKVVKSLKHGFCIHPSGGWPNDGTVLTYWQGCDNVDRLKLDFFKLPTP